jgi:hypothetical protein
MTIDQFDLIFQFCVRVASLLAVTAIAINLARLLGRPCGTYGGGLPERRVRQRIVLRDPEALVAARLREVVSSSAA